MSAGSRRTRSRSRSTVALRRRKCIWRAAWFTAAPFSSPARRGWLETRQLRVMPLSRRRFVAACQRFPVLILIGERSRSRGVDHSGAAPLPCRRVWERRFAKRAGEGQGRFKSEDIAMPDFPIRKVALLVEEIRHEGGPPPAVPRRRAAAMALVEN